MLNSILNSLGTTGTTILSGLAMLIITDLYKSVKKRVHICFLQRKLKKTELKLDRLRKDLKKTSDKKSCKLLRLHKQELEKQIRSLKQQLQKRRLA